MRIWIFYLCFTLSLPARISTDRTARVGENIDCSVRVAVALTKGLPLVDVTLEFDHYFNWLGPETADVDVRSALTGGLWVNAGRWSAGTSNPEHVAIDISAHAADISTLQVRWRS